MKRFNMQFTLEEHFKDLSDNYEDVNDVYCLWNLLKRDITEKLTGIYRSYPYFSKHDASHSRTIITNIELFLGEERIRQLSATDTLMLLICAYMHDYGMALDLEEIFTILNDSKDEFKNFLKEQKDENNFAKRLLEYYNQERSDGNLKELYYSILIMLQDFNRPYHWVGVEKIRQDYENMFAGRIKARFVTAIIDICQIHGQDVEMISTLSSQSNGMFADVFHPRFIAAMIRLGDLLDLDNNRFSNEFELSMHKKDNLIPYLSKLHYLKHESITNFLITPTHIDIEASCTGDDALALSVAREIYNWLHWLENDCLYLKKEWDTIAQRDFGTAPGIRKKTILVNGTEYQHFVYDLRMELPSDKIFDLLTGSNVYENKYVAFREIIQNAIDATLLQVWKNFYNNLSPDTPKELYSSKLAEYCLSSNFDNEYAIKINVIENQKDNAVYVEVIDSGIGISDEDLQYMCRIGESNICNPQRHKFIEQMPDWFVPSGVFGIGLQSAFQLTNEIEFFTKKANRTPRYIRFSSYSSNQGKIEVSKCPNSYLEQFNKISTQGTLVRLKINPNLFNENTDFDYYDFKFEDFQSNNHVIYIEIIHQIIKFFDTLKLNYVPIMLSDCIIDYSLSTKLKKRMNIKKDKLFYNIMDPLTLSNKIKYYYENNMINLIYWNYNKNIFFKIQIPPCNFTHQLDNNITLISLQFLDDAFTIEYKYNAIKNYENLFNYYSNDYDSKVYNLNHNIIRCLVNIFDKNPENYLNIDRNVLKYGKISYSDITKYEEEMFSSFCRDVTQYNLFSDESYVISVVDFPSLSKEKFFPILSILFYRFANEDILHSFKIKYGNDLKNYRIFLTYTNNPYVIPLTSLLGENDNYSAEEGNNLENKEKFFVYDLIDEEYISFFKDVGEFKDKAIFISDLYEHFPRHFLVPVRVRVQQYNSKLCIIYECQISRSGNRNSIETDDLYWKLDCIDLSNANKNFLNKTVLKPNSRYEYLIIKSFPKSFKKSSAFRNILDQNVSTYIISPLDQKLSGQLFECKKLKSRIDLNNKLNEIINNMVEDPHFKKCVEYVKNNSCILNTSKSRIIDDYMYLINDIGEKLFDIGNHF